MFFTKLFQKIGIKENGKGKEKPEKEMLGQISPIKNDKTFKITKSQSANKMNIKTINPIYALNSTKEDFIVQTFIDNKNKDIIDEYVSKEVERRVNLLL
jgi:hypothetical protein